MRKTLTMVLCQKKQRNIQETCASLKNKRKKVKPMCQLLKRTRQQKENKKFSAKEIARSEKQIIIKAKTMIITK